MTTNPAQSTIVRPKRRLSGGKLKSPKLQAYLERLLICLDILDVMEMTEDAHIGAAHKEALALWKEPKA